MANQAPYWDDLHRAHRLTPSATGPSNLALATGRMLHHPGLVLELGCGSGRDARYFSEKGHSVVATDISPVALREARSGGNGGVTYVAADTASPLPMRCERFDVVYSRLSLHYFTDSVTRQVLAEISRVLRPGGVFVALFRSTRDPLYARGTRLEQDMYALDGHVRHFVDPPYLHEVTALLFDVEDLGQSDGDAFGYSSSFTRLTARKRRSSGGTG
ncbi:Methyltransferase domain-containing protein [Lentzea aerocolonigenes]|nr:Methyltransferase domain-containing protein [Lentzea aerocolonigenes]